MKINSVKLRERTVKFLRRLLSRYKGAEDYFEVLERTAESEEERNERLAKRVELKRKEFELKLRIEAAKIRSKKLKEEYLEFDPKAPGRRMWKIYGLVTLSAILFFMLLRSCTGC